MKKILQYLAFLMFAIFFIHLAVYYRYGTDILYLLQSFFNWSLPIMVAFIICAIVNGYIDPVEDEPDIYDLSEMD